MVNLLRNYHDPELKGYTKLHHSLSKHVHPTHEGSSSISLLRRIVSLLPLLGLLGIAFNIWGSAIPLPLSGGLSIFLYAATLALVIIVLRSRSEGQIFLVDKIVLGIALVAMIGYTITNLYANPGYGTDEAAYQQYAAQLLMHGLNPYTHNLVGALTKFQVPVQYATYTLNGGISSHWAYPALALFITVPFILITHGVQSSIIANVTFLAAGMVLAFAILPRSMKPLAPLIALGIPILFGYALAGTNDIIMMPFLILAVIGWDEFGGSSRRRSRDFTQAISMGCAISVQQLAWFVAPFIVFGILSIQSRKWGWKTALQSAIKYSLVSLATFIIINAPFIVWNTSAWIDGILAPLLQHAIPYGQGLIGLALFWNIGGGNIVLYTYASMLIYVALLWVFFRNAEELARVATILPLIVFFFPTRSLAEYFMTPVLLWLVAATTVRTSIETDGIGVPTNVHGKTSTFRDWLALIPGLALVAVALFTPSPINLRVARVSTDGQLERIWKVQLLARNTTRHRIKPAFEMNYKGQATPFWHVVRGPRFLRPGQSGLYEIVAPDLGSMPAITTPFVVQAVTSAPESVSVSKRFIPGYESTFITPSYINSVVEPGETITFHVQLRSPFGAVIHRRRVPVALSQVIYAQSGLAYATTTINNSYPGKTPVIKYTNTKGVATFHISNSEREHAVVYYQASILSKQGYPYGYSNIVTVDWGAR